MDETNFSDVHRTLRLYHSEFDFGPKRVGEVFRAASDKLKTTGGRRRGLRVLSVGASHGFLLEDALTGVADEVSFECMDCIEPNSVMSRELETRMNKLGNKYGFKSKTHTRKFSSKEAPSFLPNDFYDLIMFSHSLYFFDNPAECLEVALFKLANQCGRVYLSLTKNEEVYKICQEIQALADGGPLVPYVRVDIDEILPEIASKITVVSRATDEAAILMHLALKPDGLSIGEKDAANRKMYDDMPKFVAHRDIDTLLETSRAQVQGIIRKYVVYSYGFPLLPMTVERLVLTRKA